MSGDKANNVCKQSVFEKLFHSLAPGLRNFLMYKFQNTDLAEDTVQEAFVILWKNCKKVTVDKAKSYLYQVAKNQMLKGIEHQKVQEKYMSFRSKPEEEVSPGFLLEYKELSEKLKLAIEKLPDGQREAFLMHRYDKKTYAEIADELGVSVKAVEKRIHKALVKLREICEKI